MNILNLVNYYIFSGTFIPNNFIEDLIIAAHNKAKDQLKTKTNEEISKATGEFGIPGFKWPL